MAKVITYNLRDVSREDAAAKGETFLQCWKDFRRQEMTLILKAAQAAKAAKATE